MRVPLVYLPCCPVPNCLGKQGELSGNSLPNLKNSSFCLPVDEWSADSGISPTLAVVPTMAFSTPSVMPPSSSSLLSEFESAYAEMLATLTQEDEFVSDKKRRTDAMWKQVRR